MADEPAMLQVPEDQMKAMYEEYRNTRNDNLMLLDALEQRNAKIKELESSKNCS